jgi:hypothetical protein
MKRLLTLLILCVGVALAQVPVKETDGNGNEKRTAASGRYADYYLQAITTSGTTITSANTYVQVIYCTNSSGTDRTITLADTQGSPVTFMTTVNVAANSVFLFNAPIGLYMQGVKITASANSAILCQVQGTQQ